MTTDQELLELAAKAAGLTNLTYCPTWKCMAEFDIDKQGGYFKWDTYWNPLKDDSDALRLAVKLGLTVVVESDMVFCRNQRSDKAFCESGRDLYAATRRAIVRAAAEIGKTMP